MKRLFSFCCLLLALCLISAHGQEPPQVIYTDAATLPLYGKAIESTASRYQRFPAEYESLSRDALWKLSLHSTGLYVRFRSDAPAIHARWTNRNNHMPHMADVGVGGLDLYAHLDGKWRFVGSGFNWKGDNPHERRLVGNMQPVMREYMLYLPLYDALDSLQIGVPEGYLIREPALPSPASDSPVVMYGTSILQGGCASRPGMAHTAILSRALDREVINLGFSGNARLDLEVAQLIAQAALFARLVSAGEQGLFYVPGEGLIGTDGEATVDGCHFTDLGMMRYVEKLLPVVREALKRYN